MVCLTMSMDVLNMLDADIWLSSLLWILSCTREFRVVSLLFDKVRVKLELFFKKEIKQTTKCLKEIQILKRHKTMWDGIEQSISVHRPYKQLLCYLTSLVDTKRLLNCHNNNMLLFIYIFNVHYRNLNKISNYIIYGHQESVWNLGNARKLKIWRII